MLCCALFETAPSTTLDLPAFGVLAAIPPLVISDEAPGVADPGVGAVHGAAFLALKTKRKKGRGSETC